MATKKILSAPTNYSKIQENLGGGMEVEERKETLTSSSYKAGKQELLYILDRTRSLCKVN